MNNANSKKRFGIAATALCLIIAALAGCARDEILPYVVEIGEEQFHSSVEVEVADINGDGIDEIIYLRLTKPTLKTVKPSIRIETFDSANSFDQINVSHYGSLNVRKDKGKDEAFYGITYEEDLKVFWKEYNLAGEVIRRLEIIDVQDKNENGDWNGRQEVLGFCDVNDDGVDDPIFYVAGDEVDEEPRAIIAFDGMTEKKLWDFQLGPMLNARNFHILDVNNDGAEEFVFGTSATDNGVSLNGYTDDKCYVFALKQNGTVLWKRHVGNKFSFCWVEAVKDIDNDGLLEVIYLKRSHNELEPENDGIFILDAATGELEKYSDSLEKYEPRILVDDVNRDGKMEVLAYNRSGTLIVFDSNLSIVKRMPFNEFQRHALGDVTDLDGNGNNEIIIVSMEPSMIILSEDLEVIAKTEIDSRGGFKSFFIASNTKSNINHLYFQRFDGYVSRINMKRNIVSVYYDYVTPVAIGAVLLAGVFLLLFVRQRRQFRNERLKVTQLLSGDAQGGIVLINNNFHIEAANEAAHRLLPEAFVDTSKNMILDMNLRSELQILEKSGLSKFRIEGLKVSEGDKTREIDVIASKIDKAPGSNGGYVLNLFDKDMEARSKLAQETVLIGQELMHKIKTLILVYSNDIYHLREKLKKSGNQENYQDVLDEMDKVSRNITEVSKAYMTLSKIDGLVREETDLNTLLVRTIKALTDSGTKSVDFVFELNESLECISIDREHVQNLIINLVENAMNAIDSKGQVTIRSELYRRLLSGDNIRDYFSFSIEDNGCGIEETMIPRLFEPGVSSFGEHIGLGLTISKRIVDLHEGEIVIESVVNKGTVVTVRLPY